MTFNISWSKKDDVKKVGKSWVLSKSMQRKTNSCLFRNHQSSSNKVLRLTLFIKYNLRLRLVFMVGQFNYSKLTIGLTHHDFTWYVQEQNRLLFSHCTEKEIFAKHGTLMRLLPTYFKIYAFYKSKFLHSLLCSGQSLCLNMKLYAQNIQKF